MKTILHSRFTWLATLAAGIFAATVLLAAVVGEDAKDNDVFNRNLYDAYLSLRVASEADIATEYELQQATFMPLLLPDGKQRLTQTGGLLTVADWGGFSKDFAAGLIPLERDGVTYWPVRVMEDPATSPRRRLIVNAKDETIAVLPAPKDYDPAWWVKEHYPQLYGEKTTAAAADQRSRLEAFFDGSRLTVTYDLIDQDNLIKLVWHQSFDAAARARQGHEPDGMLLRWAGGSVTNIQFVEIDRADTNGTMSVTVAYPDDFTNRIALLACADLVAENWTLLTITNPPTASTNALKYVDLGAANYEARFYLAFNADHDGDQDGINDYWEKLYGLNRFDASDSNEDPDGDGFSNLEKYGNGTPGTDPTDPTDHPSGAIYVATTGSDSTGAGTYNSPYASISNGIAHASSGQRVVVLPGEYSGARNRALDFAGKSIMVTGLKGHRDDTEIDCDGLARGFIFHSGEGTNAVLRHLTVRDGEANSGGGIFCTNASPCIVKCTIRENRSTGDGGGIYASVGAQPVIDDCEISENEADDQGGGVYLRNGGFVLASKVEDNTCAEDGGGLYLYAGGTVTACTITANTAEGRGDTQTSGDGGGGIFLQNGGSVANCTITGNWAYYGGGAYCESNTPTIVNCFIADNDADNRAGGVYVEVNGTVNNCTIVANRAHEYGGGVYAYGNAVFNNTIIYHNTAVVRPNCYNATAGTQTYRNCCTTPTVGTSAVTSAPLLAGVLNPHLTSASSCLGAGSNAYASGTDIDGEARICAGTVDIGCDEYAATNITGALDLDIEVVADATNVLTHVPVGLHADISGRAFRFEWRIETASGQAVVTNLAEISREWTSAGQYDVTLWATNADGAASATLTIAVATAFTNYVSASGAHVWPFTSWANASTSVQAAVDAAYAGGVVIVTNGTYNEQGIVVEKALSVQSVNGATVTTVHADGSDRVFRLDGASVVLRGFTVSGGGGSRRAGGVYVRHGSTVRDCTITGNEALNDGGGLFVYDGGTVTNCTVANNRSGSDGGGVRIDYGGLVANCTITNNTTSKRGGGVHIHRYGTVRYSSINYNAQTNNTDGGGGVQFRNAWSNAIVEWCTIRGNSGFEGGGTHIESEGFSDDGVYHDRAVLRNCSIIGNTAAYRAGGVNADDNGDVKNCLIIDNATANYPSDNPDGGGARVKGGARLMNCTVCDNNAGANGRGDGVRCQSDGFVYNCIVYFNDSDNTSAQTGGTIDYSCASDLSGGHNISGNPLFVYGSTDDYRIQSGSPCKNVGSNTFAGTGDKDMDGNARIVNTTVDMGCYEVQP